MKFSDLPVGANFTLGGTAMTKRSPLLAEDDLGGRRLVPRSAQVQVSQEAPAAATGEASPLDRYHDAVITLLREQGLLNPSLEQSLVDLHATASREAPT